MAIAVVILTWLLFRHNHEEKTWAIKDLVFPILGGACTAFDLSLWNTGLQKTTVANATLMSNTAPVWVVLFSVLILREKYKKSFWVGLALVLSGAVVVLSYDFIIQPHLGSGDLISLASGLFYGGYYLSTRFGRTRLKVMQYLWTMTTSATVVLLLINLVMGFPLTGYPSSAYLAFLGSGILVQCIAYFCVAYALGHIPVAVVSATIIIQPVLSTLLAIPVFGEKFIPVQWFGMAAVLAGIYQINRSNLYQEKPTVEA